MQNTAKKQRDELRNLPKKHYSELWDRARSVLKIEKSALYTLKELREKMRAINNAEFLPLNIS